MDASIQNSRVVEEAVRCIKRKLADSPVTDGRLNYAITHFFKKQKQPESGQAGRNPGIPPVPPHTLLLQSKEELERIEATAHEAIVEAGFAGSLALPPPRFNNKGGRPKGRRDSKCRRLNGFQRKRAEPTAAAKLKLGQMIVAESKVPGQSKRKVIEKMSQQLHVSVSFLDRISKETVQNRLAQFIAARSLGKNQLRAQGSSLALINLASRSQGKRIPGKKGMLGNTDYQKSIWLQTAKWAHLEEANGHMISSLDLLRDFRERLEAAIT